MTRNDAPADLTADDRRAAARATIERGRAALGIELGSTRIKACLVGDDPGDVLAVGSFDWENEFVDGVWTYDIADVWTGLAAAFAALVADVQASYGVPLRSLGGVGVSAMMHGYLPFADPDDPDAAPLVPFRTWRNTSTGVAAAELTRLFDVNIPLRWSIAHLHQAVLDAEPHVPEIRFVTTLAGYVHWRLTGRRVLGVGDASGMFPIGPGVDAAAVGYDTDLVARYARQVGATVPWASVADVLPEVLPAGADAGSLTAAGAALLDATGTLQAGAPACPPEGDAGTGMVATNAVAPRTGNVIVLS